MAKQTISFILGLIGGIIGLLGGISVFIFWISGGIIRIFGNITGMFGAILFSILGIISASLVRNKRILGGWLMLISGVGILISMHLWGLLPGVLLIIGGILALVKI